MYFHETDRLSLTRRLWLVCACALITIALLSLGCSDSGTDDVEDDNDADNTPPAAIADLHVIAITTATIELGWTSPGDDGNNGCALEYDLRGALDSITAADFAQAYRIDDIVPPIPAGMSQSCLLDSVDSDQTYYFAIKTGDDAGNWSAISNCISATTPANVVINFPDSALERVVRTKINRPTGDIFASDVDTIWEFNASEEGVTDLTGLEYFTGMVMLHAAFDSIPDLSPLQNLSALRALNLGGSHITDLSPIAGLTGLTGLGIGQNPFTSAEVLRNMTALEQLRLNGSQVTDFSPVHGLTALRELDLSSNPSLGSIAFLSTFSQLGVASLSFCGISDLSPLAGLTDLEEVYLSFNSISNVSALSGLPNLNTLALVHNSISDISPLVSNTGLATGDFVYLDENPLSEESLNTHIPALQARGVTVSY